jgi:hypothetical protein
MLVSPFWLKDQGKSTGAMNVKVHLKQKRLANPACSELLALE